MLRSFLLAAALSLAPASFALAAEAPAGEADSARAIDVFNLITPVVSSGRLSNYLFVNMRIHLADGVDVWRAREKGHFLRDALLKATHARRITRSDRPDSLDETEAQRVFADTARQVLGANSVKSIEIVGVTALNATRPRSS